jgi:spermidine synthase
MSQVLENTVYTFAAILSVYLLGAAIGGGAYQLLGRRAPAGPLLGRLVDGLCLACLGGVFVLSRSAAIYAWGRSVFGRDLAGSAAAEGLLAAAALGVPAILMGATFSHLAQSARGAAQGVGRALGLNTLGGALAPFVFGVALLPAAGSRGAMVLLALGYLLLAPGLSWARLGPAAAAILLAWLAPRDLVLVGGVNGGRVLLHREGVMATVAVVDDPEGNLYLKINDLYREGGTRGVFGERRQAHLPLLLHPDPRRALFLGVGTGLTLGAGASHPRLDAVGVELVPEVVGLLDVFHRDEGPLTRRPNVRIAVADARRYARASPGRFDVVVADLFHPARDGSGFLYTREHFGAVKALLAEGGLFCQWLPLYQLDASVARTIVRSFLDVFPEAGALIAHYNALTPALGLVGSSRPLKYRIPYFERRAGDGLAAALDAQRQALYDDFTLFGAIVAGRGDLARFAGPGPLNTDDLPIVRFEAPRFIYAGGGPPYAVLAEILRSLDPDPSAFLESEDPAAAAEFAGRLRRYLAARDRFVEGAVAGLEGRAADMLALYVDSARASPDFETGYALAVHEAAGIAREDPAAARAALRALVEIRPGKSQAAAALRDLFGE